MPISPPGRRILENNHLSLNFKGHLAYEQSLTDLDQYEQVCSTIEEIDARYDVLQDTTEVKATDIVVTLTCRVSDPIFVGIPKRAHLALMTKLRDQQIFTPCRPELSCTPQHQKDCFTPVNTGSDISTRYTAHLRQALSLDLKPRDLNILLDSLRIHYSTEHLAETHLFQHSRPLPPILTPLPLEEGVRIEDSPKARPSPMTLIGYSCYVDSKQATAPADAFEEITSRFQRGLTLDPPETGYLSSPSSFSLSVTQKSEPPTPSLTTTLPTAPPPRAPPSPNLLEILNDLEHFTALLHQIPTIQHSWKEDHVFTVNSDNFQKLFEHCVLLHSETPARQSVCDEPLTPLCRACFASTCVTTVSQTEATLVGPASSLVEHTRVLALLACTIPPTEDTREQAMTTVQRTVISYSRLSPLSHRYSSHLRANLQQLINHCAFL
jgi:hypothetical protein